MNKAKISTITTMYFEKALTKAVSLKSSFARMCGSFFVSSTIFLFLAFLIWGTALLAEISSIEQFFYDIGRPIYWTLLAGAKFWLSPLFLIVIPILLIFTVLFPADFSQRIWSRGLRQDLLWSAIKTTLAALILTAYTSFLNYICEQYFAWMKFELALEWPIFVRAFLIYTVADFLYWLRHVALHKVPGLWHFHAIHHSQREMNPFTIDRVHPVEYLITLNIWFIPMFVLAGSIDVVVGLYLVRRGYDAFVHSNIRTNLGPLKYLLVTPQSHRIHHSRSVQHYDTNFGAILSIWDFLFRTRYRKYDEYPPTGISDIRFPTETNADSLIGTAVKQFFYPFRMLFLWKKH
jgi:sterol desaturase/sphingolipid hydroxylase (fatty acid hydroxylase superfamily)